MCICVRFNLVHQVQFTDHNILNKINEKQRHLITESCYYKKPVFFFRFFLLFLYTSIATQDRGATCVAHTSRSIQHKYEEAHVTMCITHVHTHAWTNTASILRRAILFFFFVINACKQNTLLLSCECISVCARRHWAYQPRCDTPIFTRVNKLSVTCSKRLFFRRVKHFQESPRLHRYVCSRRNFN